MPEAGATEHRKAGRESQPLPVAARRRIWDAVLDRLLASPPSGCQGGDAPDRVDKRVDGRRLPEGGRRQDGEAA